MAFTADGKSFAAAAEDGLVRVWDLTGARAYPAGVVQLHPAAGAAGRVAWLTPPAVFSPDGKHLVTAVSANGTSVIAWDAVAGKQRAILAQGFGWVHRVEFLPGGSVVQFHRPRKERDPDNKLPPRWTSGPHGT